jgi:hypothetical protein
MFIGRLTNSEQSIKSGYGCKSGLDLASWRSPLQRCRVVAVIGGPLFLRAENEKGRREAANR